jgi:hypothetical protein
MITEHYTASSHNLCIVDIEYYEFSLAQNSLAPNRQVRDLLRGARRHALEHDSGTVRVCAHLGLRDCIRVLTFLLAWVTYF